MACNLVTNFEVALIKKKLWQCSVLSRTLPSPPPTTLGEVEGTATPRLPGDPWFVTHSSR